MTAEKELPDEPGDENEGEDSAGEEQAAERSPGPRFSMPSLDAFAAIQRRIAFIDFPAINAAQRLFDQSGIAKALEAQDAIAKHFARSVDFARLTETPKDPRLRAGSSCPGRPAAVGRISRQFDRLHGAEQRRGC